MSMLSTVKIVLTGGPGSGKTESFQRLKNETELKDFAFLEEQARRVLTESPGLRHDISSLHSEIYRRQLEGEDALGGRSFITDRGSADIFAFHPEALSELNTTLEAEYVRYTTVIQLGSAANLGTGFYRLDDVRNESIDEALAIEASIRKVWQDHPGYRYLPATEVMENKYGELRRLIVSCIGA